MPSHQITNEPTKKRKKRGIWVKGGVTGVAVMGPRGITAHTSMFLPGMTHTAIMFRPPLPGDYTVSYTTEYHAQKTQGISILK